MPKPDHIGTCNDCAYFVSNADAEHKGQCHYHPPQVVQIGDPIIKSVWPAVWPADWCGQWADPAVVAIELEERIAGTWRGDLAD